MNFNNFKATQLLIKNILKNSGRYKWSLQGFGMLRLYLDSQRIFRLHIWDSRFAVEGVTRIHDHPWDLSSLIVSGSLINKRFVIIDPNGPPSLNTLLRKVNMPMDRLGIVAGEDASERLPAEPVDLYESSFESYVPGDIYNQRAEEIHLSAPEDGTVTLVQRGFRHDRNRDHAYVFKERGTPWIDAKPRLATLDEVETIMRHALTIYSYTEEG